MLSFFPLDVLDEIWDLIESVSGGFLTYSYHPQQSHQPQAQPQVSQPKTGAVEVLLNEVNDLKKRVQQEKDQRQRADRIVKSRKENP